jgi:hypothetical protein
MNRLHYFYSTLKEHGVKVKDGSYDFRVAASKFCEPWGKYSSSYLGFDPTDGKSEPT